MRCSRDRHGQRPASRRALAKWDPNRQRLLVSARARGKRSWTYHAGLDSVPLRFAFGSDRHADQHRRRSAAERGPHIARSSRSRSDAVSCGPPGYPLTPALWKRCMTFDGAWGKRLPGMEGARRSRTRRPTPEKSGLCAREVAAQRVGPRDVVKSLRRLSTIDALKT